jgi:hypothetical protein
VIGGVATSTLLTLVVVPVLYTYVHAFALRFKRTDDEREDNRQPDATLRHPGESREPVKNNPLV